MMSEMDRVIGYEGIKTELYRIIDLINNPAKYHELGVAAPKGIVKTDYTKHPQGLGEFRRPHQKYPKPEDADIIDMLIRNTYKVLFTRGQKGLYLYVMDDSFREYIRAQISLLG